MFFLTQSYQSLLVTSVNMDRERSGRCGRSYTLCDTSISFDWRTAFWCHSKALVGEFSPTISISLLFLQGILPVLPHLQVKWHRSPSSISTRTASIFSWFLWAHRGTTASLLEKIKQGIKNIRCKYCGSHTFTEKIYINICLLMTQFSNNGTNQLGSIILDCGEWGLPFCFFNVYLAEVWIIFHVSHIIHLIKAHRTLGYVMNGICRKSK